MGRVYAKRKLNLPAGSVHITIFVRVNLLKEVHLYRQHISIWLIYRHIILIKVINFIVKCAMSSISERELYYEQHISSVELGSLQSEKTEVYQRLSCIICKMR